VGAGVGLGIGLLLVKYINEFADLVGWITGRPVFDPSIYYFQKIPTIVEGFTATVIVIAAVLIAVIASILPAVRAAQLHPVEALRYE
jgi:lipoprotein-releasing system permease protein